MSTSLNLSPLFPVLSTIDKNALYKFCVGFIICWVVLELVFYYLVECVVIPGLQQQKKPMAIENKPVEFIKKILDLLDSLDSYNITRYVEGFFHCNKLEQVHKDNLRSFLSWAMFGKSLEQINTVEQTHLKEISEHIDGRYEELKNLKPGFNKNMKHCSFTLEPISYIHRPLILYILAGLSEFIFNIIMFRLGGYQALELNGFNYWIKQGSQDSSSNPPLLIFHGISPGWSLYGLLIKYLQEPNRTIILVDFDSIKIKSMKFHCPTINQFSNTILGILRRHHINNKISIVGHSFGSILAGWLVERIPDRICHLTLIDPVSLLLAFPDVAYSFLYKSPKTFWEWIIYLAAAKEITVAHALYRNFCWHRNILWLEDVADHIGVVVGIGSADEISDMKAVGEYVKKCSLKRKQNSLSTEITCVEWNDYHHGQILVASQTLSNFISVVKSSEKMINYK